MRRYYTAVWECGTPYYPADEPFATLAGLRRDVSDIDIAIIDDAHQVILGSVECDVEPPRGPADIVWSTWQEIEIAWAGGVEGSED